MKAVVTIPKGYIFDTFFTKENIKLANSLGEIIWNEKEEHMTASELKEKIKDCDVCITSWGSPKLDKEVLDYAPRLKLLTHLAGSVVPFVSDELWKRGIRVISGNEYFAESTAEGALAYMLAALRNIPFYNQRLVKEKIWAEKNDYTNGLLYKTVGVISYGSVAKHLVKQLQGFNVKIKVYDIVKLPENEYNLEQCSIEEIFSTCDIITVHTPSNDKTYHMIDDRLLSMIKKGALLVNTSRGEIIDQRAMTKHLENNDFNAALDVFEQEPIDMNDPLLELDNVLLIPHQGGVTTNLRKIIAKDLLIESANFVDKNINLKNEILRERAKNMSKA